MGGHRSLALCVLLAAAAARADGLDLQWRGAELGLSGFFTAGVAWRMQARAAQLLGKTDVPGQQTLCQPDDCMSLSGNPAPNERLVHAAGAFAGVNTDNGDMNYGKYDVVAATTKLTPTLTFSYGPVTAKLRGILFYDPANVAFQETHNNTLFQPAHTERSNDLTGRFARGYKWREAFVSIGDERRSLTLGNQMVTWGEAVLTQFNTLNEINPYDANVVRMPGGQVNEFRQAVPAITVAGELGGGFSGELFYQLGWVPVILDAEGSFFSTSNVLGGGRFLIVGLGQYAQDPNRKYRPPMPNALITSSTRTAYLLDEHYGDPRDTGQFGAQLKYYSENFNAGTEFGLYYLHYHSRVPYLSAYAADASCTRSAPPGSFIGALIACRGFNGSINPVGGLEPLPVDTLRPYLDYPEDIDLLGLSFNTTVGHWSLAGEYAFRPNMPLQIAASDVIFAAESPAFPPQNIPVPSGVLGSAAPFTIPGNRTAVPDFLSVYRGVQISAHDRIRGYERFRVGQFSLVGIRQLSATENPFGADSLLLVVEVGGENVSDLPPLERLQLEGAGDRTHHSPGADGTGDPNGQPNSLRINPTQQVKGFATDFSWGYRALVRLTYDQIFAGINLMPALLLFHDLGGVSPANAPNFVSGRKTLFAVLDCELTRSLKLNLQYQIYTGGGQYNVLSDRDNLALSLSYSF
ncbi:MAG: DUF1302 family protein [Sinobacteraceae bacterium]|nr:DUF1302 family protein [Nevskiaceae bacterium]